MKNNKGFTLTEVIVTSVIVAALAVVAIPAYNSYIVTAQTSMAQQQCQLISASVAHNHNQGTDIRANTWTDLGMNAPNSGSWQFTFPALGPDVSISTTYKITATDTTGKYGTWDYAPNGSPQWVKR